MLSRKLILILYALTIWAFVTPKSYTFNNYLELFFLILVLLNCTGIHKKVISFFFLFLSYFVLSALYVFYFTNSHYLDFLLIYKFFVYAILLSILFNKKTLEVKTFYRFYQFLLSTFVIKYFYEAVIIQIHRPTLFYENNFELMFLGLLFYLYFSLKGKVSIGHQIVFSSVFVLSKSMSGFLILLFILIMVNYKHFIKKIAIIVPVFIVIMITGIYILKSRLIREGRSLGDIERVKFLKVFLREIENWNILNFLFGAPRITSLSAKSCNELAYFQTLFSYSGDGETCYSVVYHSYILRAIYDHGLIILFTISYFVYALILYSGYSKRDALTVLGIVFINGLSVSSFNSIYFVLAISFFLIVKNDNRSSALKRYNTISI